MLIHVVEIFKQISSNSSNVFVSVRFAEGSRAFNDVKKLRNAEIIFNAVLQIGWVNLGEVSGHW